MSLSQVIGATFPPLIEDAIGAAFDKAVARDPAGLALVSRHQAVRWTWAELGDRVDAVARALLDRGLMPGDRVGIWAPNCAEWAITQFATAKAGLILVNINPAYRLSELEYALTKVGCAALILAPSHKSSDYVAMIRQLDLPLLRLIVTLGDDDHGFLPFAALEAGGSATLPDSISAHDPVNIQFTSGTTGHPKGATLSHRNILNNGFFVGHRIGLRRGDRICVPVPLYHCFGMVMANLACVNHGATIVYPDASFDPLKTLEAVEAERCTALYGVPTMFIAMLNHAEFGRFDLSSLRTGIMAGSPCPIATMREVIARMNMSEVTIAYGMTETSPVSFQSDIDDPIELKVSTVGRVQPHLDVKVVDGDGAVVPCDEPGELCTRGYSVMLGYWDDPVRTTEAIDADGFMHTGDLATIDADGYCRIVGRIKDMVIRGGENIYPREIEEYLLGHPAIVDAQVVGVADERLGEELAAWVILRSGHEISENDLRAFCREKIAHFKIPRYIRFVDAFPMTVTGKIQKFLIRQQMHDLLGMTKTEFTDQ